MRNKNYSYFLLLILFWAILNCSTEQQRNDNTRPSLAPSLIILGTVQDAGSPHIACTKDCCSNLFNNPEPGRKVVSLGLVDPQNNKSYIFDATPDFPWQMKKLKQYSSFSDKETPDGIFLTHAHIGHYTGLMYLGREAMGSNNISVYAMLKMKDFLESNGPWSQLVTLKNISIQQIQNKQKLELSSNISVEPFLVPHRDEFSETVGYKITGPNKKALFIPDIDKWGKWDENITYQILEVDYAFLDASFYDSKELDNRDISEIPHPFIIESIEKFKDLAASEKNKIHFIHFNHTNPVLNRNSTQAQTVLSKGFNIAEIYSVFEL